MGWMQIFINRDLIDNAVHYLCLNLSYTRLCIVIDNLLTLVSRELMAVVANRQTEIMQGDNGAVAGRVVDTVVNERTGFATQHERVVEAEEDEDGNTKIEIKERTRTYKLVRFTCSI